MCLRLDGEVLPGEMVREAHGVTLPTVSVIIVNYNYAAFIGETIRSVLAQSYERFECLVVDNGSTDRSLDVARAHIGSDPRFSILSLDRNLGHIGGGLTALRQVQNEFVVFVDADDVLFPSFLAVHLQVHLASRRGVALTSTNIVETDAAGSAVVGSIRFWPVLDDKDNNGLRPADVAPRLPMVGLDDYRRIHDHTFRVPRDKTGWMWAPGTSNMYRLSMLRLFALDLGDEPIFGGLDCHFNHVLHSLTGSMLIDIPMSARRMHGSNDYSRMPNLAHIGNGNAQAELAATNIRRRVLETILDRASRLTDVLNDADLFFGIFDHVPLRSGRKLRKFLALLVPSIARNLEMLGEIYGESRVLRELRARLGLPLLLRVVAEAPDTTARRWIRLIKGELRLRTAKLRKRLA